MNVLWVYTAIVAIGLLIPVVIIILAQRGSK